jgi:hypothetical protein
LKTIATAFIAAASLAVFAGNRYTLKVPDGLVRKLAGKDFR